MRLQKFWKLEKFEDRHPGLCRQLEAMLKAFIPLRAIARAFQAQYGVRIGRDSLREYKWECWNVWGKRLRKSARPAPPLKTLPAEPTLERGSSSYPVPALVRAATA
jgi:hypothetical protein